jgi:hypothetical protein
MKEACPDLLAVSVYDTKPVHILSTAADCVEWVVLEKKVWSARDKHKKKMKHLRLNLINYYNHHMNSVDMADQLRGNYRPDRWFRNRKWWWSFFIWGIGVAGVNAYKIYTVMYAEEKAKKKGKMPRKWTHAQFLEELAYDMIFPEATGKHVSLIQEKNDASLALSANLTRTSSVYGKNKPPGKVDLTDSKKVNKYLDEVRPTKMTKEKLESGAHFPHRHDGLRHAWVCTRDDDRCQYCYYKYMHKYNEAQRKAAKKATKQKRVRRCLVCNVNHCAACDNEFHGVDLSLYKGCAD